MTRDEAEKALDAYVRDANGRGSTKEQRDSLIAALTAAPSMNVLTPGEVSTLPEIRKFANSDDGPVGRLIRRLLDEVESRQHPAASPPITAEALEEAFRKATNFWPSRDQCSAALAVLQGGGK